MELERCKFTTDEHLIKPITPRKAYYFLTYLITTFTTNLNVNYYEIRTYRQPLIYRKS